MTTVTAKHRNTVPPHVELDLPLLPAGYEWEFGRDEYSPGYIQVSILDKHKENVGWGLAPEKAERASAFEAGINRAAQRAYDKVFPPEAQVSPYIGTYTPVQG